MPSIESRYSPEVDKPKEKCAIVGVVSFDGRDISPDVVSAIIRMDNRGQEGSGIATFKPDQENPFNLYKKDGYPKLIWNNPQVLER